MSTATPVHTPTGFHGDATVYRLDPPYVEHPSQYGDKVRPDITHESVVVSAVDLDFGGFDMGDYRTSETMIFPSDGEAVTGWGELAMVPLKSHEAALAELGYTIAVEQTEGEMFPGTKAALDALTIRGEVSQ